MKNLQLDTDILKIKPQLFAQIVLNMKNNRKK